MTTALFSHEDCTFHDMGLGHPECPARINAIRKCLTETRLIQEITVSDALSVSEEDLLRVHPLGYIQQLKAIQPRKGRIFLDPDTALMPHTLRAAHLSAGAAVQATQAVLNGAADNAFCLTRPPGHHAEYNTAKGFCFFNNVAVAVRHAMAVYGLKKVAVIDFDVHQCNGTVDIFENDPDVLVCSSFQHPCYPNSHFFTKSPNIINSPLEEGDGSREFRQAAETDWLDALQSHQPEMLFVSAGFDAHREDPMADINLIDADYRWITQLIRDVANSYCQGRIVSVLEGGYNLDALGRSAQQHIEVLAGK